MYRLLFINGKFKGKRLTIQQGAVLIGRDPECQIDLDDDDEVSRHHALIESRGGSPVIRDLDATNRVLVNDQPVKEHRLRSGDRIEIGRTLIEYQAGSSAAPPKHRRRFSKMQATSFAAIGLIVLLQVVFVILFPLWQKRETVAIDPAAHRPPAPPPVATAPEAPSLEKPLPPAPETSVAPPTTVAMSSEPVAPVAVVDAADAGEPPLPPAMPAPAMEPTPSPAATEVMELRSEIEGLRKMVENIGVPPTPPEREAVLARVPSADPLQEKAREMLVDAQKEIQRMNYFQADNILERIQMMTPKFVPAFRERAVLYEQRGMLMQAGEQWQKVMNLTAGTPLYEQAAAERQRIARLEVTRKTVEGPASPRDASSARRLEKRIRIASVERERFRANEEYDEMRLIRITLRPRNNERDINADQVLVSVTFYDRVAGSDRVVPTRALVPEDGLRISGAWAPGEARTVSAAYIVGKNFRAEEQRMLGERRDYEGYRVRVYYRGVLQDESAMPNRILDLEPPPAPGSSR
ncbi:MAG TPA: FHA domain-containing protein [Kiritimatiellia bacterium]|nr:FHA domain-containing protein [Kiritimatiellia bacterium]HMP34985.1 FHA domain-containing protein [Kiritimatiellia bacterium]